MKHLLQIVFVSILFFISSNLKSQEIPFTVLHFSDSHSYILGSGIKNSNLEYTHGGLSRVVTIISNTRATDTNVLVFHSGDIFTGDFFFNRYLGSIELSLLSKFKLDAIAVGNHEFDLGPQALYQSLTSGFQNGAVPMLSANLDLTGFPALNNFISPYTIKEYDRLRIGIFGLTFPDPSSNPSPVIISDSILQRAALTVQELYAQGCSVVICLSHLGLSFDSTLASIVPGIHIILGGHDHSLLNQPAFVQNPSGFNTIICHPGDHYDNVGKLKFTYFNGNIAYKSYEPIDVNESIPEDTRVKAYINAYKQGIISQFGEVYSKVISVANTDISPEWNPDGNYRDTPLGNLVTDAYRYTTGTQISITAKGLLDEKIYEGKIVGNDLFRAAPYGYDTTTKLGFNLIKFSITGLELKRALELIFLTAPENVSFFPQFSGLTFDYDNTLPAGQKIILSSMLVNDTAISLGRNYSTTVNTGLFGALNQLGIQVSDVTPTGIPEYRTLYSYVSGFVTLNYVSQGRIKEVTITGNGNITSNIKGYSLYDNYPNPFNASTIIKYSLPKESYVIIKVYDITGKELSTLISKVQRAGDYSLRFDGNSYSTGVYFYRMVTSDFTQTKKFVLIK
jgi:5'-nucleotidase